jgi:hypothetical protein
MALDKNRPYGQCIGGVLHGCAIQDDRYYRNGVEVDVNNEPVKQPAKNQVKKGADAQQKEPDKEPDTPEAAQLAAQLVA